MESCICIAVLISFSQHRTAILFMFRLEITLNGFTLNWVSGHKDKIFIYLFDFYPAPLDHVLNLFLMNFEHPDSYYCSFENKGRSREDHIYLLELLG